MKLRTRILSGLAVALLAVGMTNLNVLGSSSDSESLDRIGKYVNPKYEFNDDLTELELAARNGDAARIYVLAAGGANLNLIRHGVTPLYYAVTYNRVEAVRALLQCGADPNVELFDPLFHKSIGIAINHVCNINPSVYPDGVLVSQQIRQLLLQHGSRPEESCHTGDDYDDIGMDLWANPQS